MKIKGFILLAFVAIICTVCVVYGGYSVVTLKYPVVADIPKTSSKNNTVTVSENKTDESNEDSGNAEQPTTDETPKDEQAVQTAAQGQALGTITARKISPYSAGTSYNSVYLKNNTGVGIDIAAALAAQLGFKIQKSTEPQVLIFHTHTTECYMNEDRNFYTESDAFRTLDENKNMIAIGNVIEHQLQSAGIAVLHDKTVHDHPSYNGSYSRSADSVLADLKAYPSIKVVIDVHRDSITDDKGNKYKPVVTVNGKQAAQVMLVMGSETGGITNFPNWQQNLNLATKYQQTMEVMYPELARPLLLNSAKYNEHLTTGSMLLEVGCESNTFDEAAYGAELAGKALASFLNTIK